MRRNIARAFTALAAAASAVLATSAIQPNGADAAGWKLSKTYSLSSEPSGTAYTTGVRTNTDQSYSSKSQATYGANGLTITAQRKSGKIYSADVMLRGIVLPDTYALQFTCTLTGLGSGMFPAAWERGLNGSGEADIFEYVGANAGVTHPTQSSQFPMKSTLILTGSGSDAYNMANKAFGIPLTALGDQTYEGTHVWRYEKTLSGVILLIDGKVVGSLTGAQLDAQRRSSKYSWAQQFGSGKTFYPRFTFQVGNGTHAHMAGPVPSSWSKSTMTISNLQVYVAS